ncbi:MAG: sugar kinase [Elusimicrobia bacterium]|nr:sugar kinase [Elusimicrobiota bacterium]
MTRSGRGDVLVVGSVAMDSVVTSAGESRDALGGSAVFFSLAARFFARVRLVGVVGADFPAEHRGMLESKGVDLEGLETVSGKTFRWKGGYSRDFHSAKTLETHLNVFRSFRPRLSPRQRAASVVFLANIDPELQWEVLSQMEGPRLVACDTMNYWIKLKRPALKELLSRVDIFFVNEAEARALSREPSNYRAARVLSEWGPSIVVIKKGEHGALLMAQGRLHALPAYPVEEVKDPTGAGDTFAGGFMGYLASLEERDRGGPDSRPHPNGGHAAGRGLISDARRIKRAMLYGTVLASYNVQDFGTRRLESLDFQAVQDRCRDYLDLLSVHDDADRAAVARVA